MDEESRESQISRRRMLKRIGAGAAVAWTAPVLTSLRAPAFAQGRYCNQCTPDNDCINQIDCSAAGDFSCCCGRTPEGPCFCYQHGSCGNACSSQADCAPGTTCVASCCGFACQSACTSGPRGQVRAGQRATYPR
jgi:hypothetical protein